jgi:hypothetical protein
MYLRTVLRSLPVRSAIADTDRPYLCSSRIVINSFSSTTHPPSATAFEALMVGQAVEAPAGHGPPGLQRPDWGHFIRPVWGVLVRRPQVSRQAPLHKLAAR